MATPKKLNKIRDSEATRKKLVECVAEIVRTEGFHSVKVNKIARLAEKDKGVIRYHFGGLNNLLRTYITQKDYWPPFFERYKIDSSSDQGEVKEMFTALMQENLQKFFGDEEMQKIILWQISEGNPVLRQISEERETEGQKLFALTDPTFLNSGINFKAVIALLLGGSYYAVLQSQSIKTKVCGVDLNLENHREEMRRTIGQIISWAYEKAYHEKKNISQPMSYELEKLENIVEKISKDQQRGIQTDDFGDSELLTEVKDVERVLSRQLLALANETQIKTFLHFYLTKLIRLCDALFDLDGKNENAKVILELIDTLRVPVATYIPEVIGLPKLFRKIESEKLKVQWGIIENQLRENGISNKLIEIIHVPVKRFIFGKEEMRWRDYKYLRRYVSVLGELVENSFSEDDVLEHLIGLGFNYSRFSSYYVKVFSESLSQNIAVAKKMLLEKSMKLQQVNIFTRREFDPRKLPIIDEIVKWIDAEIILRENSTKGAGTMKLVSKFKAVELAFWEKLQYDHGIYEEENLEVFSEKIAYNFSTKSQEGLSAASMKSKFYPKEKSVIVKIEKILVAMLDDTRQFMQ